MSLGYNYNMVLLLPRVSTKAKAWEAHKIPFLLRLPSVTEPGKSELYSKSWEQPP
jgi:hypothetical protein